MKWYIVMGRMYGDDEATSIKLRAGDKTIAITAFKAAMREAAGFTDEADPNADVGFGHVYIDAVWCCGYQEPMELL